jgi:large subunit ribosomal protein L25
MKTIELNVKPRTTTGKGHARRARAQGILPAIVYGGDLKGAQQISLDEPEAKKVARAVGHNVFISLKGTPELNGKTAMIREVQRHPLKLKLIHADFITIDLNKPVVVEVEVELTGKPVGLAKQGVLTVVSHSIEVKCLPKDVPEKVQIDVSHLDLHDSLHIADVKLPANVTAVYKDNYTIATVAATREEVVKVVEAVPVEGAAPAAGAAGAPAAAGAAPAAGAAAPAAGAAGAKPAAGGDKGGAKK